MVTQLHLALVTAIDADLLVLDEPTLGLDILYRKQFYDRLVNDYCDGTRTVLITTHQVEEVESLLTHLMFINRGELVLCCAMDQVGERFREVVVGSDQYQQARQLRPIHERSLLGKTVMLFEHADPAALATLGEQRVPGVADLFVALFDAGRA